MRVTQHRVFTAVAMLAAVTASTATTSAAHSPQDTAREAVAVKVAPVPAARNSGPHMAATTTVQALPFDTVTTEDSTKPTGVRTVTSAGVEGVQHTVSFPVGNDMSEITVVYAAPVAQQETVGAFTIPATTDAPANRALGQQLAAGKGWTGDQWSCLDSLFSRESGWRHNANNASSGAYGIPQSLPGKKMAVIAADWATNPATQIEWGLAYIGGRYGTPCAAWAHSEDVNWY